MFEPRRPLVISLVLSRRGRLVIALAFIVSGLALVLTPRYLGLEWSSGGLLTDLGSEFLGLALTVSILDWFFEQRRLRAEGRRLAWETFHQVERAVWIWQGGPLRLETDELLGLLRATSEEDQIARCTEGLLLGLGIQSRELLKAERRAVGAIPGLTGALGELTGLARIGETRRPSTSAIRDALLSSARSLADVLDLAAPHMPARLIRHRDATPEAQEKRYDLGLLPV